jgi:hypothetical protein
MKISAIASILAFATAPLSAYSTSTYYCKLDAGYEIEDDASNPTYPTNSEKNWAAGRLKTSYQALHNGGDFSMASIGVDDFTLEAQRFNKKKNLRAESGAYHMFDATFWSSTSIACIMCGSWDDDDAAGAALETVTKKEADWLTDYVKASQTHQRWVDAFCDELQQGPHAVFEYAQDCQIHLYDCDTSLRNNKHEIEVIKIHEGEAAMKNEDIEMEVDASHY